MVADTSSRGSGRFPEISIHIGPSKIALPPAVQIAAVSAMTMIVVALCYLGASRVNYDRLSAQREAAVVRAETANADLQDEMASLREKIAAAIGDRQQAEERLLALASQSDSLRGLLSTTEAKLQSLEDPRGRAAQLRAEIQPRPISDEAAAANGSRTSRLAQTLDQTQRAALAARLSKVEPDHPRQDARRVPYKADLEAAARRLRQMSVDRDKAIIERDRLRARIAELEQKRSEGEIPRPQNLAAWFRVAGLITTELVQSAADQAHPEPVITDAPPEAEHDRIAEFARRAIGEFRRALASTGLNVERLFPQFGVDRAEGGPFVLPPKGEQARGIGPDRLEAMHSLIKSLPLSAPLELYQLESRFGPRHDPFNRRPSFHTGIDLSAPYMSPVHATAGGVVTYAGYRADYGKVVEIDHGNGIATIYGHLHRYVVAVGQRVAERTQIGFLGSTGRSSGPHVHYEVLVNGEAQDPEKFLGLARVIPAADR